MELSQRTTDSRTLCLAVLLACVHVCSAQSPGAGLDAAPISERAIASLQQQLAQHSKAISSAKKRRACRSTVRKGEALIDASPAAPNRFRVLAIVLKSQKQLLGLENSSRNRKALYATCSKLAKAPDAYADLRLDADMLLSDRALTLKDADTKERARALAEMIKRYRNTSGEAKSLLLAALIAPKLEAFELEREITLTLDDRFSGDHSVIEFRRKHLGFTKLDVLFNGRFTRSDGVSLTFPADQFGQPCIMVFWSRQTPGFEKYLAQVNVQQSQLPGRFTVFSFNVDELPDAGEKILRDLKLDWSAMRLPGGKRSRTFRTYGRKSTVGVLVNAYGHALLTTPWASYGRGVTAATGFTIHDKIVPHDRSLRQLQSLLIGDFLVAGSPQKVTAESVPAATLSAIQACFTAAPMRYRQTRERALANYQKAEKLCRDAIAQYPEAPDLSALRNRRIIALLGMWKLAVEPKHLVEAVQGARTALAVTPSRGANIVPRFCLAVDALRRGDLDPESVLSALVEETVGTKKASAHAAAAILALYANSPELHGRYRELVLEAKTSDPMLWSVVSFLRDRYHTFHLFKASDPRHARIYSRGHIIDHGGAVTANRFHAIELETLDGGTLSLPRDTDGKLTLLLFMEPPADPNAELPLQMIGRPAEGKRRAVQGTLHFASNLAGRHIRDEVNVVAAFLSDDGDRIKALAKKHEWGCQVAMVPGGLDNPMVRRLGIVSADRVANVFLLRRDGTIAWHTSGLKYKAAFSHVFSVYLAMKVQIEVCDTELAYRALAQGDYKKAASVFSGPFLPERDERFRWAGPRFHGRALAHMGLKDWKAALADIDVAIEDHRREFKHAKLHPCRSMVEMQLTRAIILEKLGRVAEAKEARERAAVKASSYPATPYELFHGRLRQVRISQN